MSTTIFSMRKNSPYRVLSADVEYEVLLRLPVKTLSRFKCCCKPWYSLISSSPFQQDHFRRSSKNPLLLTVLVLKEVEDLPILQFSTYENEKQGTLVNRFSKTFPDPYPTYRQVRIVQSCLGWVCLASRGDDENIFICKPSTEELIYIPQNNKIASCIGFGHSASTHEFKVVKFSRTESSSLCEVFTLGTSTGWRISRNPPHPVFNGIAPYFHGSLHLLVHKIRGVRKKDYIAAFDLDSEEYRSMALPVHYDSTYWKPSRELTELGGSLCLSFRFSKPAGQLELWLLKDYNNVEWIKGYTIDLSPLIDIKAWFCYARPVGLMGDESILLNVLQLGMIQLWWYDPHNKTLTQNIEKSGEAVFYVDSFSRLGCR